MSDDIKRKLTSRRFWVGVAAFLGSLGTSIAGVATGDSSIATVGMVCAALSAAIYQAMEALVDYGYASANTTATTKAVALTGNATKANLEQVS